MLHICNKTAQPRPASIGVLIQVGLVLPYLVLPRLYGLTKGRVLVAQFWGGVCVQLPLMLLGGGG